MTGCLTACSSNPTTYEHYVLNSTDNKIESTKNVPAQGKAFVIESVELSRFLSNAGLVLQTAPNKLIISTSHLWAENLDQAIPKTLLKDFQHLSDDYAFYLKNHKWLGDDTYHLHLRIDNFHATQSAQVVLSGRYQILKANRKKQPLVKDFQFNQALTEDGYQHSVTKMNVLLNYLAEDILQTVKNHYPPEYN